MSATVRIIHVATGDAVVVVTRHRRDVPAGEPHSLIAEDRLAPGEPVTVTLAEGEIITLHEKRPHGR